MIAQSASMNARGNERMSERVHFDDWSHPHSIRVIIGKRAAC